MKHFAGLLLNNFIFKKLEIRIYEKCKFITTKYRVVDKRTAKHQTTAEQEKKSNDRLTDYIWKLMKYTQGENDQNLKMKLHMPIFIHIVTLASDIESKINHENSKTNTARDEEVEVTLMITLPPEYQFDPKNPDKFVLEPPSPNDETVTFETVDEFKCYVRLDIF